MNNESDVMLIHNFYGDLLLYTRYLFNKFLGQDFIKNYQFNIGNISQQIDYNKQPELPAAIIEFNTSEKLTYPPSIFQGNSLQNKFAFPVLFDEDKDLALFLQEVLHTLQVSFVINVNSQLAALNTKHMLERFMPPQNYITCDSFTSFYELNEAFLHPAFFDVNKDSIMNLFLRTNKLTDGIDFCFSVKHDPIIKLESCDVQIGDSSQRSFSCSGQISFIMGVPMFVYIPEEYMPNIPKYIEEHKLHTSTVKSGNLS